MDYAKGSFGRDNLLSLAASNPEYPTLNSEPKRSSWIENVGAASLS